MTPDEVLDGYEALVARALKWAEAMGDGSAMQSESRWLGRWEGRIKLFWLLDDEDFGLEEHGMIVPPEAFKVPEADFAAWAAARRPERDEMIEKNMVILRALARRTFGRPE